MWEQEQERCMGCVLELREIDRTQAAIVGGKGANLGELSGIPGVSVPDCFCVTTDAFRTVVAGAPGIDAELRLLSSVRPDDQRALGELGGQIRAAIGRVGVPDDLVGAIDRQLDRLGRTGPFAIRSSATAEDLPDASFAGQQDTYLNISGPAEIVRHIRRCWASLFTDRAVAYRARNGIEHRTVQMAVVVQEMVAAQASGVLFTADPISGNRRLASVEAVWGLGEGLVSGRASSDSFKVRDDRVVGRTIAAKLRATQPMPAGGTAEEAVESGRQLEPALTDAQVVRLVQLGRRIEAHFGAPQDIEWCLAGNGFQVVQSRPITTLFPVPPVDDGQTHVYLSVGHQQMMTAAMKPLGLSLWQLTTPARMTEAGGRLFVDVTQRLSTPAARANLLELAGRSDPLIGDALRTVLARDDIIPNQDRHTDGAPEAAVRRAPTQVPEPIGNDPAIVAELIDMNRASVAALRRDIADKSGSALLDFIFADIPEMKRVLFHPRSHQAIMASMEATWWLNDNLQAWLGERNAADILTRSVPDNITSDMGLALLDIADVVRLSPAVVNFLERVEHDGPDGDSFLDDVAAVDGGSQVRDAIRKFLVTYGMRCDGEIDVTRPRWSERPATLVPVILSNVRNFQAGARERRLTDGREQALAWEQELLQRLRARPDGEQKAAETAYMIDRVRTFAGYREYPKYGMMCRYFAYKQALMGEAGRLVQSGVLQRVDDIFYLTLEEVREVVRTQEADRQVISERRSAFRYYSTLTPPRVMTSDGEAITGSYARTDLPAGAMAGLAVSAGTVEGRARVVTDMAAADLEPGNILVTTYTDPSWTPLFVAAAGLVTEVGGLMTHGAVIAREYGLPAVVGVEGATRLISDGQRIRVHGTEGYVEVLTQP
jgi:pyruvate,water dikinase